MSGTVQVVIAGERELAMPGPGFVAPAPSDARPLRVAAYTGQGAVPVDETTEVVLHVRRGTYLRVYAVACGQCTETFSLLHGTEPAMRDELLRMGWRPPGRGGIGGWLCPGCRR